MKKKVSRRTFVKKSAGLGAASILGGAMMSGPGCVDSFHRIRAEELAEMAVVKGEDDFESTVRAVAMLGGMGRFVSKNDSVCILPNSQNKNPGTYTKPAIVRAVIDMCLDAGAREVRCLSWLPAKSWEGTGVGEAVEKAGGVLQLVDRKDESLFRPVAVPRGKILKEARIMDAFFSHDVFINMPISKDHVGNRFTGTLKNLMGLSSPKTNRTFHTGNFKNDDIGHLDQCIADLNTIVSPSLCVVDSTEFIVTNGPFGPGELKRPRNVVAGIDRVAIDAFCATLWDLDPGGIIMIDRAHEHGLGEIDYTKLKIRVEEIVA